MENIYQVGCAKASSENLINELNLLQHKERLVIDEIGECEQFIVIVTTKMSKAELIRAVKMDRLDSGQEGIDYLTVRYLATASDQRYEGSDRKFR